MATRAVFRRWDYPVFAALTLLNLGAVAYFTDRWLARGDLNHTSVIFLLMTAALLLGVGMYESRWLVLPLMRRPVPIGPSPGWRVGVATTFVPGAESIAMLEETVAALVAMEYPHDTWVLDEGDLPEVRELCRRLGAHHSSRRGVARYQSASGVFEARTKHGNYNAWLDAVGYDRYDIVCGFDPDHIPVRSFLHRVLGYFDAPEIGYVQAAQVYYNQSASFIARGAAEETYAYYSSIQMTSYALGYPIVTGCHNTHRAKALKDVGGFSPHEADDLLITVLYRASGWKGVYVPEVLAHGLTPVDWSGYLGQQRRWARSVLDIKLRVYPRVARQLPRLERVISLLHGLYYLQGLVTALQIALLVFMLVSGIAPHAFGLVSAPGFLAMIGAFQLCDIYRQRFLLDRRHELGFHIRGGFVRFAKWPWVLLALVDAVTGKRGPYIITTKGQRSSSSRRLLLPHLATVVAIVPAWIVGMATGHIRNPLLTISAAFLVLVSSAVYATGFLHFPAPYDPELRKRVDRPVKRTATSVDSQGIPAIGEQDARIQPTLGRGDTQGVPDTPGVVRAALSPWSAGRMQFAPTKHRGHSANLCRRGGGMARPESGRNPVSFLSPVGRTPG